MTFRCKTRLFLLPLFFAPLFTLPLASAQVTPSPSKSEERVIVKSGKKISEEVRQKIKLEAERTLEIGGKALGCDPLLLERLVIYLCPSNREFSRVAVPGALGTFVRSQNTAYINCEIIAKSGDKSDIMKTVRHECAHKVYSAFVGPLGDEADSTFLNEGYATLQEKNFSIFHRYVYISYNYAHRDGGEIKDPFPLTKLLTDNLSIYHSLEKARAYDPDDPYFPKQYAYGQGASFVLFLCDKFDSCKDGLRYISLIISHFKRGDMTKDEFNTLINNLEKEWIGWERDLIKTRKVFDKYLEVISNETRRGRQVN